MYVIIGIIVGALGGAALGFCLEFASCVIGVFSCSYTGVEMGTMMWPLAIVGAVIGGGIGAYMQYEAAKSDKEKAEKDRRDAEQAVLDGKYNEWYNELVGYYDAIEKNITCGRDFSPGSMYEPIWQLETVQPEPRYKEFFHQEFTDHTNWLRGIIDSNIKYPGYYAVPMMLSAMRCLKTAYRNDSQFDSAISTLTKLYKNINCETYYIKFTQYGDCIVKISDPKYGIALDKRINELDRRLNDIEASFNYNLGKYYEELNPDLPNYIDYAAEIIWCIASKKPFNQDEFNKQVNRFNAYTIRVTVNNYFATWNYYKSEAGKSDTQWTTNVHVERMLALVYAKNLIGGQNTVNQEKKGVIDWINRAIYFKDEKACFLLASGLAWMDLFELERDVLRQLFEKKVNFEAEHQDRLSFLEGGGTTNIKIYDAGDMDGFLYDSSADGWNNDAYDLFFRKLDMSHKNLDYSLAISKWTKTLPLASGQKVSQAQIEQEFIKLVDDFDGEIVFSKERAKAINLANVEYENSFIFRFKSERNRCVSILFSSEKYGRNLNTTIITMFTPENGLNSEQLKKYALAIKDNLYVQSFRESVLQVVDQVTKEKQTIYDDEPSKKIFS